MKRAMKQATVTRAGIAGLVLLALGTFGSVTFSESATRDLQEAVAVDDASGARRPGPVAAHAGHDRPA